jgi:hypothetical protein
MARTWQELFETGTDAPAPAAAEDGESERRGFFKRLRDNMSKTRQAIGAELQTTIFQAARRGRTRAPWSSTRSRPLGRAGTTW